MSHSLRTRAVAEIFFGDWGYRICSFYYRVFNCRQPRITELAMDMLKEVISE